MATQAISTRTVVAVPVENKQGPSRIKDLFSAIVGFVTEPFTHSVEPYYHEDKNQVSPGDKAKAHAITFLPY